MPPRTNDRSVGNEMMGYSNPLYRDSKYVPSRLTAVGTYILLEDHIIASIVYNFLIYKYQLTA